MATTNAQDLSTSRPRPQAADAPAGKARADKGSPNLTLGWAATIGSVMMYFAYIDQISRNLHGHKGSIIQPAAAFFACSLWALYGLLRRDRDWPLVWANIPGITLSAVAFATAL